MTIMVRGFSISCVMLTVFFISPACKDKSVHKVESSGSDSTSTSEHSGDTATQTSVDTTSFTSDSEISTEAGTETSVVFIETDSLTDSTPSTDTQFRDTYSDSETDKQESTDSSTILVETDSGSSDSVTVDTDVNTDTGTGSIPNTDWDSASERATDSAEDTGSTTENGDDTNTGPDSETAADTETEHLADCGIVGVNDFGDCDMFLGWAKVGNHCAPIEGCSCDPDCDRFFETEDACVVECFGLIACGGSSGNTCADDQYCDFKTGEDCGEEGATAVCRIRDKGCEAIYWPVCGCDGNTYANDCEAGAVGWGYRHEGVCSTP